MINLKNLSLRIGGRLLFEHVNLLIYAQQKIGLIGENGSGKTTLFRAILGELHTDDGDIIKASQCRIAHLAQELPALSTCALDYVCEGDTEWLDIQQKLLEAEQSEQHQHIAELHEKMQDIDGYTIKTRAAEILHGLGFSHEEVLKSVAEFSGGWRMRLNLAQVLISRSDFMLLDEPTNHLDFEAILWLEKWLAKCPTALLLISHDRDFLDGIVSQIAHLDQQTLTVYKGNYSTFEQTRAEQIAQQQASFAKQQAKVAHLKSYIDRFRYKASKATQAQSRIKMLERMQLVAAFHEKSAFQFSFRECVAKANPLISIENGSFQYQDTPLLTKLNLSIPLDARIGILGENGAGKSTFFKILAGRLKLTSGINHTAPQLKVGYFAQHQIDELILHESPMQHLKRIDAQATEQTLRTFLGRFNFSGNKVFDPITHFSGGEKTRLAFALMAWQKPELLLLDEPTNHLDIEMREALMQALQEYQGAILVISHDRYLLRACVDEFWVVGQNKVTPFDGSLEDYQAWYLAQQGEKTVSDTAPVKSKNSYWEAKEKKKQLQRLKTIENELPRLEQRKKVILEKLAADDIYSKNNQNLYQQLLEEKKKLEEKENQLQDEWLTLSE